MRKSYSCDDLSIPLVMYCKPKYFSYLITIAIIVTRRKHYES